MKTSKSIGSSVQATNSIAPEVISAAICDGVGLDAERIYEAISEGVYRAMWQMITNATSMPCHDFYDAIKEAAQTAFENAATYENNASMCSHESVAFTRPPSP